MRSRGQYGQGCWPVMYAGMGAGITLCSSVIIMAAANMQHQSISRIGRPVAGAVCSGCAVKAAAFMCAAFTCSVDVLASLPAAHL